MSLELTWQEIFGESLATQTILPHLAYRHTSSSRQICDILNSTDLFLQASLIIFTNGANNSDHDCKNENLYVRSHMT